MFLSVNLGQQVTIHFPFTDATFANQELHIVLIYTFAIGILWGFLFPVFLVLEFKMENYRLERKLKKIQNELNSLRNVAIQEELEAENEIAEMEKPQSEHEINQIPESF